jgi:hypothetical protein
MNPNSQSHPLCNRGSPLAAGGRASVCRLYAARPLRLVATLLATSPTSQGRTKNTGFLLFNKLQDEIKSKQVLFLEARA